MRGFYKYEYFVPTRTVNITKYLTTLRSDIFCDCLSIKSYSITNTEAALLTYINEVHCENIYGHDKFNSKSDLVVRLEDVIELYKFLKWCTSKLTNCLITSLSNIDKFGFVHIFLKSKTNCYVPYNVKDGHKYVPLFYFQGQMDTLKDQIIQLMGWDLVYLKFCFKIQGIREVLYQGDSCVVIKLDDIIPYFEPVTVFEDFWPSETIALSQLWHDPMEDISISPDAWFKKPCMLSFKVAAPVVNQSNIPKLLQTTGLQAMMKSCSSLLSDIPVTNSNLVCIQIFLFNLLFFFKYIIIILFCRCLKF